MSIQEIFFKPYQIGPKPSVAWSGILFRIFFADGKVGYADYTPLEAYGDPALVAHNDPALGARDGHAATADGDPGLGANPATAEIGFSLSAEVFTRTVACARLDAEARSAGRSLWQHQKPQSNHFLLRDLTHWTAEQLAKIAADGFSTVKIKLNDPDANTALRLNQVISESVSPRRLRLDLNSSSSPIRFRHFTEALAAGVLGRVEFVEDPFPFSQKDWAAAHAKIPLAIDHEFSKWDQREVPPFRAVIVKPARQEAWKLAKICAEKKLSFAVTSSLDHWLGVAMAAWVSGDLKRQYPELSLEGGCLTFPAMGAWIWGDVIEVVGNHLVGIQGSGFGFDQALTKIEWQAGQVSDAENGIVKLRTRAMGSTPKPPLGSNRAPSGVMSLHQPSPAELGSSQESSRLLLNPKTSPLEQNELQDLVRHMGLKNGVWMASSGSSQKANESLKLVHLTNSSLLSTAAALNRYLGAERKDVWLQGLPEFHVGGYAVRLRAELAGFKILPAPGDWSPEIFWKTCEDQCVTLTSLVPTQIFDLVGLGKKAPSRLRTVLVGGASLSMELYAKAWKLGYRLYPSYGMTETGSAMAAVPFVSAPAIAAEFIYAPLDHMFVHIGIDGLLRVKGEGVAEGYAQIRDGKFFWQSLRDEWGCYTTSDMAEAVQTAGDQSSKSGDPSATRGANDVPKSIKAFALRGRSADYVKILGEGVNLAKIQSLLDLWAPGMCAIFSEDDARRGKTLAMAILQNAPPALLESIQLKMRSQLFPYEQPSRIQQVKEIPRSPIGKILREKLR